MSTIYTVNKLQEKTLEELENIKQIKLQEFAEVISQKERLMSDIICIQGLIEKEKSR